jgi:hypothetical protein
LLREKSDIPTKRIMNLEREDIQKLRDLAQQVTTLSFFCGHVNAILSLFSNVPFV